MGMSRSWFRVCTWPRLAGSLGKMSKSGSHALFRRNGRCLDLSGEGHRGDHLRLVREHLNLRSL